MFPKAKTTRSTQDKIHAAPCEEPFKRPGTDEVISRACIQVSEGWDQFFKPKGTLNSNSDSF